MEDAEILDRFWKRDEGAIPAAEEQYGARLLRLAERLLGSREDAEECVSDTWLAAWNAIPPEWPEHLFAYLARVCRNLALDRLDWRNAQKRKADVVTLTAELEDCIPDTRRDRELDGKALGALLTAFLEGLSEEARLVFLRRYWYGDTIQEVARRYGCSESKVKMLLFRTRKKLRSWLEKEGISV